MVAMCEAALYYRGYYLLISGESQLLLLTPNVYTPFPGGLWQAVNNYEIIVLGQKNCSPLLNEYKKCVIFKTILGVRES